MTIEDTIAALHQHTTDPLPVAVVQEIEALGKSLRTDESDRPIICIITVLKVADRPLAELLALDKRVSKLLGGLTDVSFLIDARLRELSC